MGNGSSKNSRRTRGKPSKAPPSSLRSIEPHYVPVRKLDRPTTKVDMVDLGLGVYYSEQLGNDNNTLLYSDEAFTNFIKSGKHKIRVMSTVGHHGLGGREVIRDGVAANAPMVNNTGGVINKDDHHFEEFIQQTRKKLRTTSRVGDSSFNRG
ncbi:hypothetical protein PIB30_002045 [Stylosanthes scabra]|uniref:Uncharacterized protein n=1 Tax=Stylosanthes scabra TaxID=79078 RepID=A0ABU6Q2U0_9FABA|nr:hypothetical protein [Stylosanthes scabra]